VSAAHEPFDELAAAYALDALEGADRARFEAHLAECAECERALLDHREALADAADALREAPPARVRHALLERAGTGAARRSRARSVLGRAASMALAAGIAAVVTGAAVRARWEARLDRVAHEAADLRAQLAEEMRTVAGLRRQLDDEQKTLVQVKAESAERERSLALLADPGTQVVSLAGLKPRPEAQARMLWNPRAGGLLVAADLPPLPEGKTYELWAIAGGKPVPAGLFGVDAAGRGTVAVPPLAGVATVDVFAVTLEPAGGVPAPTGEMYLASKAT
jgi:anti-sigma-K factor RskA